MKFKKGKIEGVVIEKLIKSPILLDLRNLYNPATVKSLGFIYERVRRR